MPINIRTVETTIVLIIEKKGQQEHSSLTALVRDIENGGDSVSNFMENK